MQIKNNQTRNAQFFYYRQKAGSKAQELALVHIPGGATVELDDAIFKTLCASQTEVNVMKEVVSEIESEVPVTMDKKAVQVKEYYETGETKTVNLLLESIKVGEFTIVERPKATMADIDAVLVASGLDPKGMAEDAKLALYDKLA